MPRRLLGGRQVDVDRERLYRCFLSTRLPGVIGLPELLTARVGPKPFSVIWPIIDEAPFVAGTPVVFVPRRILTGIEPSLHDNRESLVPRAGRMYALKQKPLRTPASRR